VVAQIFNSMDISNYFHPSLTTIRQPIYQLGYRAAEMLLDLIQGDSEVSSEILEPELIVRASTTHAVKLIDQVEIKEVVLSK
jgi:DNA-binding LacI/PurR family transcriptional regulator